MPAGSKLHLCVQIVLAVLSFLSLFVIMVMPDRHLFFLSGLPRIVFAPFFMVVIAAIVFLSSLFLCASWKNWTKGSFKEFALNNAPLLVFCLFNILFVAIAFLHVEFLNPEAFSSHPRWWLSFFFLQLAIPCAWYLGRCSSWTGTKALGVVLVASASIMVALQLSEYLHLSGYANPVGAWLKSINLGNSPFSIWTWQYPESVRAQGLGRFPAAYSFVALILCCWALSGQGLRNLRMAGLILAMLVLYLSGTRTALFAIVIIGIVLLCILIKRRGLFSWIKRNAKQIVVGSAILFALTGSIYWLTGAENFGRNMPLLTSENEQAIVDSSMKSTIVGDEDVSSQSQTSDIFYQISSGRTEIWQEALGEIRNSPLGIWKHSSTVLTYGSHPHSDTLDRLLTAGPVSLFFYLWFVWWLAFRAYSPLASNYPPLFAVAIVASGLFETVFSQMVFVPAGFFILGFLSSAKTVFPVFDRRAPHSAESSSCTGEK